ncbi:hypothetical protein HN51_038112 [Arachis hypogaea]|nr:uncharacterized protein DS421_13g434980 [Arachis hypogaea]
MMATAVSACESKINRKPASPFFSKSEIEAAKQLIQLSSSGDEEQQQYDHHHQSMSNNSCSYSVVQGTNNSGGCDVVSSAAAVDEEEDESRLLPTRKNKRYRFLEDLYSVTVPIVKSKKKKTSIKSRK